MKDDRTASLHGILRSMASLTRVLQARGAHPFQNQALGRREMDVMFHVSQFGQTMVGQLAESLNVTSGAISQILPKLERIGLIHVETDPADRRQRLVEVTESAASEVHRFQDTYVQTLAPEFAALTNAELLELERLLAKAGSKITASDAEPR